MQHPCRRLGHGAEAHETDALIARQLLGNDLPDFLPLLRQVIRHMAVMAQTCSTVYFSHCRIAFGRSGPHDRNSGHVRMRDQMIDPGKHGHQEFEVRQFGQIGEVEAPDQQILDLRSISHIRPEPDFEIGYFRYRHATLRVSLYRRCQK